MVVMTLAGGRSLFAHMNVVLRIGLIIHAMQHLRHLLGARRWIGSDFAGPQRKRHETNQKEAVPWEDQIFQYHDFHFLNEHKRRLRQAQ